MKKLFILVCVALFAGTASAQITWNMKAGAGFAHCIGEDSWDTYNHFVGKIGAGIEKPFTSNWSLMPSLEIALKGAKFEEFNVKETWNLFYLQVPVLAAYRINLTDKWNLTLKAGPYLACALSGKSKSDIENFNLFGDEGAGRRLDIGFDFGIDCEYQRYVFGAEYELGFLNMVNNGYKMKNAAFYVTIGYKF